MHTNLNTQPELERWLSGLGIFAMPAEDLGLVPRTHKAVSIPYKPGSRGLDILFRNLWALHTLVSYKCNKYSYMVFKDTYTNAYTSINRGTFTGAVRKQIMIIQENIYVSVAINKVKVKLIKQIIKVINRRITIKYQKNEIS